MGRNRGMLVHKINFVRAKSHFQMNDLVKSLPRETDLFLEYGGVSCRTLYAFGVYLYVNGSGSITSVGEERANLSAVYL